jgi:hypothetical protein
VSRYIVAFRETFQADDTYEAACKRAFQLANNMNKPVVVYDLTEVRVVSPLPVIAPPGAPAPLGPRSA